ncbi:beta-phosphoglucomutase [Mesobacillus maritimus]|uniref:beta-phosphoglucomutase n=1 Tax=Mesobacillus maritimus TaxID=1643336 RepID=UPI00203F03E6|nr:beta-phosphoglucomutase [Mesobacillus maritimus]MCM3668235.1 beta-phosphoglucomutase [Mesobacillus maritimus]
MVKAVIFDLDGVITDTAELHYQAWKNLANSISIDFDREFNEELKGISRMDSLNKILSHGGVEDQYTEQEKVELATKKNEEYKTLLVHLNPENIYPGIKELLDSLKESKLKIGLASASKNGPAILNYLQITDYFNTIVNPDSVANGKPAPDIFLKAAEQLGVSPQECIGIEDSEAGIEAIKKADMFAVGVGTTEVMKKAGADLVLTNTKELVWSQLKEAASVKIG